MILSFRAVKLQGEFAPIIFIRSENCGTKVEQKFEIDFVECNVRFAAQFSMLREKTSKLKYETTRVG